MGAALPSIKLAAGLIDRVPEEIALKGDPSEGLSTATFKMPIERGDQVLI